MRPSNFGKTLATKGLTPGTHATMTPTCTSTADHMKDKDAIQEYSYSALEAADPAFACRRVRAADSKYAILTTSTTATNPPKLNVIIRMIFSFRGSLMLVKIGIGRKSIARSVMILTGAEDRYRVTISMHLAVGDIGSSKAAPTGRHWSILRKVKARPATLTTVSVATVDHLNIGWFLDRVK